MLHVEPVGSDPIQVEPPGGTLQDDHAAFRAASRATVGARTALTVSTLVKTGDMSIFHGPVARPPSLRR